MNCFRNLFLTLFFSSCSVIQSGNYYKVKSSDTIKSIAKNNNIDLCTLNLANSHRPFYPGQLIFIPKSEGILGQVRNCNSTEHILNGVEYIWPVTPKKGITSQAGPRDGKIHNGIDIPAPKGTPIKASNKGTVIFSGFHLSGYGNLVIIKHPSGAKTYYAHASKIHVKRGQFVKKGQMIAEVGSTGNSTGPHLHFEIRQKNYVLNPKNVLDLANL
jgi:LysM repeat protein